MQIISIRPGLPLFADNFESCMTFAENWIAEGASSSENGHLFLHGGSVTLRNALPREFCLSAEITRGETARFQISICNVRAEIIENELTVGETRCSFDGSRGTFTIKAARVWEDGDAFCAFGVDDTWLISVKAADNQASQCRFSSENAEIRAFRLSSVKKSEEESPNLTINSSFECLQDDFPLFITRNITANFALGEELDYGAYVDSVAPDDTEHHSGKYSLRITNNRYSNGHKISFQGTGTLPDTAGVLSAWMKADRDGMKAELIYGNKTETVSIDREWKRYEVVNPCLEKQSFYSPAWISVPEDEKGTIWVDDVQAEFLDRISTEEELRSGKTFATPYRPSELDKSTIYAGKEKPVRPASIEVPLLPEDVHPTVKLDDWKQYAVMRDDFYTQNKVPALRTEVYIACSREALYVGYRNYGEKIEQSERYSFDNLDVFSHGVECYINPDGTGRTYMQLGTNAAGSRADLGLNNDIPWNGEWTSEAVCNAEKDAVDYLVTYAMSNFAGSDLADEWLVDICRNDGINHEPDSISRVPVRDYKLTDYWPKALLPADVMKRFRIGVNAVDFMNSENGTKLILEFGNLSGTSRELTMKILDLANRGAELYTGDILVEQGNTRTELPVSVQPKRVGIKLYEDGKLLFNRHFNTTARNMAVLTGRLSYYMNEPEAEYRVRLFLPEPQKYTAILTCAGIRVEAQAEQTFRMTFPITSLPSGSYPVTLRICDGDTVLCSVSDTLIKRDYKKGASQVDRFSRCIRHDGKPIIPFSPFLIYHYGDKPENVLGQLEWLRKYHFRTVHFYANMKCTDLSSLFMKEAEKRRLPMVLWSNFKDSDPSEIPALVSEWDYDNVIAEQVIDEPELNMAPEDARAFIDTMRPLRPYHPVYMNNTVLGIPNDYAGLDTDILMIDNYLTNSLNRDVKTIIQSNDMMEKAGAADCKPYYMFVTGSNWPLHYREPTYGEQIAQCYGSLAAGCTGITLFCGWPQTKGNWRAVLQLSDEIAALTDILTSDEDCVPVRSDADAELVRVGTRKYDGSLYIVACNLDSEAVDTVTFTLPKAYSYAEAAEVLFENRTVSLHDGCVRDNFDKWSRHVYRIRLR